MEVSWNKFKLQHPPYATWRICQDAIDIKTFMAAINKAIGDLESMNILNAEAAFLSRLIYRMKNKFRNDKGLKNMEKVNRALINYLNMALIQDYKNLKAYVNLEGNIVTLPSRQLLEYILVRTQGFAKLMERTEQVARYSAHFLKMRIKLGHAWSISLVAYATISRIWFLSRQLIKKCCNWYNRLYRFVNRFEYVGLPWIPKNETLPCDLEQWLSVEWMHDEKTCTYDGNWDDTIFKLLETHSINKYDDTEGTIAEFSSMRHNLMNTLQKDISTHNIYEDKSTLHTEIADIGEVINRKSFEASFPKVRDTNNPLIRKRKLNRNSDNTGMVKKLKKKKSRNNIKRYQS